jgi:hypothetical protein
MEILLFISFGQSLFSDMRVTYSYIYGGSIMLRRETCLSLFQKIKNHDGTERIQQQ